MADKKKVVVLVRRSPLNSVKNAEALRHAVGQTLAENQVTAILLDAAAWLALPMSSEIIGGGLIQKHLDTLPLLGAKVKVEAESLERYGIDRGKVMKKIEVISREEVVNEITEAEVVIPF